MGAEIRLLIYVSVLCLGCCSGQLIGFRGVVNIPDGFSYRDPETVQASVEAAKLAKSIQPILQQRSEEMRRFNEFNLPKDDPRFSSAFLDEGRGIPQSGREIFDFKDSRFIDPLPETRFNKPLDDDEDILGENPNSVGVTNPSPLALRLFGNSFGQPSSSSVTSSFGQPSSNSVISSFGQPSSNSVTSSFGQPSSFGSGSVRNGLGHPSIDITRGQFSHTISFGHPGKTSFNHPIDNIYSNFGGEHGFDSQVSSLPVRPKQFSTYNQYPPPVQYNEPHPGNFINASPYVATTPAPYIAASPTPYIATTAAPFIASPRPVYPQPEPNYPRLHSGHGYKKYAAPQPDYTRSQSKLPFVSSLPAKSPVHPAISGPLRTLRNSFKAHGKDVYYVKTS